MVDKLGLMSARIVVKNAVATRMVVIESANFAGWSSCGFWVFIGL